MEGRQPTPCHLQFSLLCRDHYIDSMIQLQPWWPIKCHFINDFARDIPAQVTRPRVVEMHTDYPVSCDIKITKKKKLEILTERDFAFIYSLLNYKMNT